MEIASLKVKRDIRQNERYSRVKNGSLAPFPAKIIASIYIAASFTNTLF